jgi:hypothetical protein
MNAQRESAAVALVAAALARLRWPERRRVRAVWAAIGLYVVAAVVLSV